MKIYKGLIGDYKLSNSKSSVVTIGYFDGVHRYHQQLLAEASALAKNNNLNLIVVTFSKKINSKEDEDFDLMSENTKQHFLEKHYPIDEYLVLDVDETLTEMEPEEFVKWLKTELKAVKIVEGNDFRFGHFAKGNIRTLREAFGMENVIVWPRTNKVSSTLIREQLTKGKIQTAIINLGHDLIVEIEEQGEENPGTYFWKTPEIILPVDEYNLETPSGQKITLNYESQYNFNFDTDKIDSKILYLKGKKKKPIPNS